jgi:hypothetical protein
MKIIVSLFMMNKIFLSFKDRIGRVFSPDKKKKKRNSWRKGPGISSEGNEVTKWLARTCKGFN